MSAIQAPVSSQEAASPVSGLLQKWRLPALSGLLILALAINCGFLIFPAYRNGPLMPFMLFFLAGFLPYLAASLLVLYTKPTQGRGRWLELGIILAGALVLRAMLVSLEPFLSPDSWRYLWDARVTLLGYSPYTHVPAEPTFIHLRDAIYAKMAFHAVPTIYPPAAQAVYLLSYLIAPSNLVMLKCIFLLFDLVTCLALMRLLWRRGLDPARALIYAWCPLPIIDFAIQGHLDVIAIMFTVLAILSNQGRSPRARMLTGFLVGMATLSKLYPILLLVVVIRRRDWAMLATCFATILLGYLPYILLGHGQVFGFFSTYANEHTPNAGLVQHMMTLLGTLLKFNEHVQLQLEYTVDILLLGAVSLLILIMRLNDGICSLAECIPNPFVIKRVGMWLYTHTAWNGTLQRMVRSLTRWTLLFVLRARMSMEAAMLILIGMIFVTSSHIFPWYVTALLPWICVLVKPPKTEPARSSGKSLAVTMAWYFSCVIVIHYFFDRMPLSAWIAYYPVVYGVVIFGVGLAAIKGLRALRHRPADDDIPAEFALP